MPFCVATCMRSLLPFVWSAIMRWPNCLTSSLAACVVAARPNSTSIIPPMPAAMTNLRSEAARPAAIFAFMLPCVFVLPDTSTSPDVFAFMFELVLLCRFVRRVLVFVLVLVLVCSVLVWPAFVFCSCAGARPVKSMINPTSAHRAIHSAPLFILLPSLFHSVSDMTRRADSSIARRPHVTSTKILCAQAPHDLLQLACELRALLRVG